MLLKSVLLPTFGKPTMPNFMFNSQLPWIFVKSVSDAAACVAADWLQSCCLSIDNVKIIALKVLFLNRKGHGLAL